MQIRTLIASWSRPAAMLPLCLAATTLAQGSQRYAIEPQAIAESLQTKGIEIGPGQVTLSVPMGSTVPHPQLVAYGAERLRDRHSRVALRCMHPGECIPFTATLALDDKTADELLHAINQAPSTGAGGPTHSISFGPSLPQAAARPAETAVRPGQQVTIWMEDGHISIHLPAVALDRAGQGDMVRVVTTDRKIFHALVIDPSNVRGTAE